MKTFKDILFYIGRIISMTDKPSLIFISSLLATAFSLLAWLDISYLSPNPHIWWLSVPMIIFITIVEGYIMTEAIDRSRDDR